MEHQGWACSSFEGGFPLCQRQPSHLRQSCTAALCCPPTNDPCVSLHTITRSLSPGILQRGTIQMVPRIHLHGRTLRSSRHWRSPLSLGKEKPCITVSLQNVASCLLCVVAPAAGRKQRWGFAALLWSASNETAW